MAKIELLLPAMGEGIIEATITKWFVKEGDMVEEDQPLLEVATDKVDSEIPSPVKGILLRIIKAEGEVPSVGSLLAEIETEEESEDPDREEVVNEVTRITGQTDQESLSADSDETAQAGARPEEMPRHTYSGKFMTPLVRSIAVNENIPVSELELIDGSGDGGRITKEDLMAYLRNRQPEAGDLHERDKEKWPEQEDAPAMQAEPDHKQAEDPSEEQPPQQVATQKPSGIIPGEGDRLIEMDRMRKLIAGHMVASKQTSPHVTSFIDADVTGLVRWREANKEKFRKRENQKMTYTPVFIEAAARAIRDYPGINISVEGTTIIVKKNINIGVAVALPDGNLIVPVVKNADDKSLTGLVKAVNDLAERARINKLQPNEISGGTFTITNFGTFRNTAGTPIINQPEAAILGVGAIVKKPVVMETSQGDVIAIRHMMTLSLSYDHRVVDGALGGMFLGRIAEYLESFDIGRKI